MSFKEKWNRMNRKADQAIKNAKARKTAQPDTDNTGRKEKKPGGHKVLRAIAAVCLVGIMLMCVAGCVLTVWAFDTLNTDQQMLDLSMQKAKYTTIFYADDGVTELARAYDPDAGNRIWVDYDQMPKCLLDATVAVEDKRFWEHNGVDFLTTSKAGLSAILQKIGLTGFYGGATPGASTITQQVVRNITNDRAVDGAAGWARKLREIFRALNVEKYYTKTQIIETYLNLASFSQNCSGIQAAANVFFNKDVSELTVAECATIVGTTTLGKGSVQVTHELTFGGALRYTAAYYKSPLDHDIDGLGINPDISIGRSDDEDNQKSLAMETAQSMVRE